MPGTELTQAKFSATATDDGALLAPFLEQPRRAQHAQFYSDKYWDTHLSAMFEKEWVPKRAALEARGENGDHTVNDRMEAARRYWKLESEEFQCAVQAEVELEYEASVREYNERKRLVPLEGRRREG